jgi:copper chaperone CopZ
MSSTHIQIEIENLKCGGCANTMVMAMSSIDGVTSGGCSLVGAKRCLPYS